MFDPDDQWKREHKGEEPFYPDESEHAREGTVYPEAGRVPPPNYSPPARKKHSNILMASLMGALFCLILGGVTGWEFGQHSAQSAVNTTYKNGGAPLTQVIAQGRQAVVQLNVPNGQGVSIGSGVIIDQRGDIVTNNHVVENGHKFQVTLFDGSILPARLVGTDLPDDLAVVKITPPRGMYAMPFGASSDLQVGDNVIAIGNPLGITQTVTSGIVSALGRTVPEDQGNAVIVDAIQTDAAINPGNSGGALINTQGQLIGIPTLTAVDPEFKTPANGVGFAIPSHRVQFIVPQLIKDGRVTHSGRAGLGAGIVSIDALVATKVGLSVDQGALVVSLGTNSSAAKAGIKVGDAIVKVDNTTIVDRSGLIEVLATYNPGTTVTLGVVRGTQRIQVKVKLGELAVS